MKSEMTHRERIMAAVNHEQIDRLPTDYWGVAEVTGNLMKFFNVTDMLGLAKSLDIDKIMDAAPVMKPIDRSGMWDVKMRPIAVAGGLGVYDEPVSHPLADYETIGEIEANYVWPTVDMFDYSNIRRQCERYRNEGFAIDGGYISLTYFYTMIRGLEQMLVDFMVDEELADYILYKINEFAAANTARILEEGNGLIDMTQVTDDFGTQCGLLMSESMIERFFGKYYESNIAMAKSYGAKIFHHDDGAITDVLPWITKKGCEILNPIQWHLPGWDLEKVKKEYGKKLCFHGGIDNQHVLPFGSKDDVKSEVRACIDALYSDRTGFILAPCHCIQANTPTENILTMYDYALEYSSNFTI